MNPIFIVLPILAILMFELGLTLRLPDFLMLLRRPRPVIAGLIGQIIGLPIIAFAVAKICVYIGIQLEPIFFVGLILIACCPGGSSSNVFSMLAKGDVALSVSLTAFSSIITLFTIPIIMHWAVVFSSSELSSNISLNVGNLIVQNIVLMVVPILLGVACHKFTPRIATRLDAILRRIAFPALMLLVIIFFAQHKDNIISNFGNLGGATLTLLLVAIALAAILCLIFRLTGRERRTIVIEVGMQNAAQAIAIASSPYVFNEPRMAIPAIIYALLMNIVLLIYVAVLQRK